MDWTQVLTIIGSNILLILSLFGTFLLLYLNTDKKLDEQRRETNIIIKEIKEESKEHHAKMEKIEGEFRLFLMNYYTEKK